MSRWFRFYDDALNDPKVQKLPAEKFKAWINLLCLASKNEGYLPGVPDIAFSLRISDDIAERLIAEFHAAVLLDKTPDGFRPHNWDGRQYESDSSTERVRKFRAKKNPVSTVSNETERNVSVTVQNRAEQIQNRAEQIQNRADTDARDESAKRLGNFCQAIVTAYADANSPTLPDTSRAGLWLQQGYDPEICLAVIREIVRKKPNAGLAYFEKPIAEAHQTRAPPRVSIVPPKDDGMIEVLDQLQLEAWDAYGVKTNGKGYPRNKKGGWRFPSKWPPDYAEVQLRGVERLIQQRAAE